MKGQVDRVCQGAYFELRRIGSIRLYLSIDAMKTLVTSLVLSRLDYCGSLLAGTPQILIDKIQRVMNCAARLIHKSSKRIHNTPLMINLRWLPVSRRVEYKIATICFNVITNSAPPYLTDLLDFLAHFVPLLIPVCSAYQSDARSSRGSVHCHTLDLPSGTTFPSLFDMPLNHYLHSSLN